MRYNTIVSLHNNQINTVKCFPSIVLFLMLVGFLTGPADSNEEAFTAKSIKVPDSCEETPTMMIAIYGRSTVY